MSVDTLGAFEDRGEWSQIVSIRTNDKNIYETRLHPFAFYLCEAFRH